MKHVIAPFVVVVVLVASGGCSPAPKDRYPPIGDCTGPRCRPEVIVGDPGSTTTLDASPMSSALPDGGLLDAGTDASFRTLRAAVKAALDPRLTDARDESNQTVSVSLLDFEDVHVSVKGSAEIELPSAGFPGWLRVAVANNNRKFGSVLRWTEGTENPLQLLTVDRLLYEDLAAQLIVPTTLPVSSAQLVLNVQTASGEPVQGIHLVTSVGSVAYDTGDTFNDATQETGDQGAILWLNIPLVHASGVQAVPVTLEGVGVTQQETLPVEPGGLTVAAVVWKGD